jgi:hypothetical protein
MVPPAPPPTAVIIPPIELAVPLSTVLPEIVAKPPAPTVIVCVPLGIYCEAL